jgi:hypothetical protein
MQPEEESAWRHQPTPAAAYHKGDFPMAKKTTTKKTNGSTRSKVARVAALLQRASGCTRKDVLKLTGWGAVSMQAQAKAAGLKLKMKKVQGQPIVYRA